MSDSFALPAPEYVDRTTKALVSTKVQPPIRHPRDAVAIRESLLRTLPKMQEHSRGAHGRSSVVNALWVSADTTSMYYLDADFADLFAEMRATFGFENLRSLIEDLASTGPNGSMLMAFDDRAPAYLNLPVYLEAPTDEALRTDRVVPNEDESLQPITLPEPLAWALLSWRWLGPEQGIRFSSMHMRRRLVEGEPFYEPAAIPRGQHDPATAQLILAAWVLLNPGPRMIEVVERPALAGLPPKVKAQASRAARADVVKVVRLHSPLRKQMGDVTEARRALRHRFVVRGHWRKQKVGTGRTEVRLTYVAPYVKGPDGAPFVRRETVYAW